MDIQPFRILYLSQRDTARGVMAAAVTNQKGKGRFVALSAGVVPAKTIEPLALRALEHAGYETEGLYPKAVKTVSTAGAPGFDFIFTLSDTARGEDLPEWSGQPISAHWHCDDPVLVEDDEIGRALVYGRVLAGLERRISAFVELPFQSLDRISLQRRIDAIGETD